MRPHYTGLLGQRRPGGLRCISRAASSGVPIAKAPLHTARIPPPCRYPCSFGVLRMTVSSSKAATAAGEPQANYAPFTDPFHRPLQPCRGTSAVTGLASTRGLSARKALRTRVCLARRWTKHTVIRFQRQVESVGSRLIVRRASETTRGLLQIAEETGAKSVYFNTLYDPISLVRDHEVRSRTGSKALSPAIGQP